jgi:hypothetical protein
MVYLKTIIIVSLVLALLLSGILMSYHDIKYENLWFIIIPILLVVAFYLLFTYQFRRGIDFRLYEIKLNFPLACIIMLVCIAIKAYYFNVNSLFEGNYAEIREDFLEKLDTKNVTALEQIVPLISIYPLTYLLFAIARNRGFNMEIIFLIFGLLFIGQTTGGRQIIFQLFILILSIKGFGLLRKPSSLLFLGVFVALAAIVTIGRYANPDVDKAALLENITPVNINPFLKGDPKLQPAKDVVIEAGFYFGQSVPAFCNEIDNVDITILPTYVFGLQPFVERQLNKVGIAVEQQVRWRRFLDLTNNTGFFPGTWATAFLDLYFNWGILGTILFCLITAFALYNCQYNLKIKREDKYAILHGFNILFIITTFMAPAFFDTTIIFSYLFIFFGKIR